MGQGRFVVRGQSLGVPVQVRFRAQSDDHGDHYEGTISIEGPPAEELGEAGRAPVGARHHPRTHGTRRADSRESRLTARARSVRLES